MEKQKIKKSKKSSGHGPRRRDDIRLFSFLLKIRLMMVAASYRIAEIFDIRTLSTRKTSSLPEDPTGDQSCWDGAHGTEQA